MRLVSRTPLVWRCRYCKLEKHDHADSLECPRCGWLVRTRIEKFRSLSPVDRQRRLNSALLDAAVLQCLTSDDERAFLDEVVDCE